MFKNIQVRNYQSLKFIDVELGALTIVVGASDSGKSAFFRAINTLVSNQRGSDFITHGEKLCTITAELTQGKIELGRGSGTKDNYYEITDENGPRKFTKLSGTVPEEVSDFLKIHPKDPINFASQFDKPYLLDSKEYGPSEVARILGALTNVNILFEGARESSRQKNETNATLKIRVEDFNTTESKLETYDSLEEDIKKVEEAEILVEDAKRSTEMLNKLVRAVREIEEAEETLESLQDILSVEIPSVSDITSQVSLLQTLTTVIESIQKDENLIQSLQQILSNDVADISTIEKQVAELNKLQALINSIAEDEATITSNDITLISLNTEIEEIDNEYHDILVKEGMCPTCGQKIQN